MVKAVYTWVRKAFGNVLYSNQHAAESWDLEFGSNTTEKIENSRGEVMFVVNTTTPKT